MNALRATLEWVRASPVLAILVALMVGLLAVFVIVGVFDPAWVYRFFITEKGTGTEKFRILEFIGVGMGGVLLAIGATIANRRAAAMEETNRGAEAGRRQERLKNAIEHLGHDSDSVRMGGAYELFHLARDTEDDDLRQTVLDILCAHIRWTTGEAEYREKHGSKPSTEVQSLLTLLFVQEHMVFKGCHIDLQASWLNGASLKSARLQRVDLLGAYLQGTDLYKAQLQEANLLFAHLQGTYLPFAHLQEARLSSVQLQGADLSGAQLQGADLLGAQLQGANLHRAHLQGAKLPGAHLRGVICQPGGDPSFEGRIRAGIDRESDLSEVTFAGGLSQEEVDSLVEGLADEKTKLLREVLDTHVGKPPRYELPEGSGAITGAYTEEEAEQWITEYEEAMRGVPKADG